MPDENTMASAKEVASKLGVTDRTLLNWHRRGIGPTRYILSPRCARYKLSEVHDWISKCAA